MTLNLNLNELEGRKVKKALYGWGDLEFAKQNDIPDSIILVLNDGKAPIIIEAMRPEEDDGDVPKTKEDRPWLRIRRET